MRTIDICFSKPINRKCDIGSRLIKWYMGTPYSHVSFHFNVEKYDATLVYEAVGSGIRFLCKEKWEQHAVTIKSYRLTVSDEIYNKIMKVCIRYAGGEYGHLQNLGIVIADILNLDKNPFPAHENCSELLYFLLEEAGYKANKSSGLITPRDIDEMLDRGI